MKVKDTLKVLINILVVIIIFLSPGLLIAQVDSISSRDAIRVTTTKYFQNSIVGNFINIKNDSLYFQINKRLFSIPLQQVTKLEVAKGKKSNTKRGAIIGGIAGGLGFGVIAAISVSGEQDEWLTPSPGQAFLGGLVLGSLIGSGTGAIIGSGSKSTRWEEVALSKPLVPKESVKSIEVSPPKPASHSKSAGEKSINQKRKWSLSFTLGTTSSGPAADIEKAMRNSNFDETSPGGFFGGPVAHPFSKTGFGETGAPLSISVRYEFNNIFDFGLLINHSPIGISSGYRSNPTAFLDLNYTVASISPMLWFNHMKILKLGMGFGLFMNKLEQEDVGEIIKSEKKIKLGAVFQASLIFPEETRFFVKINGQFRYIGKSSFGPFTTGHGNEKIIFPEFKADFSHFFVGFGFGIRI